MKITNPRISPEFFRELEGEPAYHTSKAFSATHAFLRKILYFSHDQEYASIPAKLIKEWFDNYNIKYKNCLDALERHDLIQVEKQYIVGAKTRRYRLTEKGVRLLTVGEMRYLKSLFTDQGLKRKLQKRESYHRTKAKKHRHPLLQHIHDGLVRYKYDPAAIQMIEQSDWPNLTKLKAIANLISFKERDFVDLHYNESDARVWNEFVGMKTELRQFFSLGDLQYLYVIDIRSCHPQFLGHFLAYRSKPKAIPQHPLSLEPVDIRQNFPVRERERSERLSHSHITINPQQSTLSTPKNPTSTNLKNKSIPHYDGGNSDIEAELTAWNQLFSDPDTDPKAVLIRELGYTREQAKAALNETINGSRKYRRFIAWLKKRFPLLFSTWDKTDKATVGVGISTWYETELMQEEDLYAMAKKLGLHLTYEFDGCGVMCRDDADVLPKIERLIAYIQTRSERLFGIRPVIVLKPVDGRPIEQTRRNKMGKAERTGKSKLTPRKRVAGPSSHTSASASRRSSGRSSRRGRKRPLSPQPSST